MTVTADDGDDSTDASSATLSITNTPPTAPIVQIDPAEPVEGEDLSCSITTPSADADGDAVAYRFSWDVDGTSYGSAIDDAASSRVDGADVGASQVWTCAVQADDGSAVSTVALDTVTSTCLAGADATCAAQSCLAVQDAGASFGDGLYWIDPDGGGAFSAWCDMTHAGGGWTRVARLDRATDGYCGGDPSPSRDLSLDPTLGAGKLPDVRVRAVVSGSSYNEILYFTGEAGRAAYLYTPMLDPYDTTVSYTDYCTWTCADGASDSTTCGSEYIGCGFGGRGTGGNRKKLYMDAPSGAHAYALHSGGGFCGLDNRAGYTADVYVR